MSLYEGAVKKPIMTSLCFLAVVIFGLFSLSKLPIDLYPDIDTNTIMVMTAYPGASASDIENNVTRPLENTLNAVSNLKHITSRSSENMSLITLEFEYGNDIDVLTNDVRDKLDMVSSQLPDDVENPIIFKFSTDMIPIVLLSVQANESQSALYKILDDRVVNPLARIPGVGTVSISGAPQREIQVYCDPGKLEAYNLTIETISSISEPRIRIFRAVTSISVTRPIRCVSKESLTIRDNWKMLWWVATMERMSICAMWRAWSIPWRSVLRKHIIMR